MFLVLGQRVKHVAQALGSSKECCKTSVVVTYEKNALKFVVFN